MADQAVENARRRRDLLTASIEKAERELADWRVQIGRVDRFLRDYETFAADMFPNEQPTGPATPQYVIDGQKRTRAVGNSPKEEVAAEARRLIEAQGSPVPREQLYNALKTAGLIVDGTDPFGVMNTMLWRTREEFGVILLRNVGYWLREREWKNAGYYPGLDDVIGVEDDAPQEDSVDEGPHPIKGTVGPPSSPLSNYDPPPPPQNRPRDD